MHLMETAIWHAQSAYMIDWVCSCQEMLCFMLVGALWQNGATMSDVSVSENRASSHSM